MNTMKKLIILSFILLVPFLLQAQDFDKNLAAAKSAYSSGNLTDARFSMEQMLRDLDAAIGKQILTMLPSTLGSLTANTKDDNVTGAGASGLYVNRSYGTSPNQTTLNIINNSPIITSVNAFLSMPFIANSGDGRQKVVKVQGYKSLLNKNENSDTGKTGYELQIPMNNTLLTLRSEDVSESDILAWANAIPLAKIAQFAQ
ncbi:MAG: hypothetical protein K1X47_04900 [Cyclobacteriaceae bacterium]|nr:hypothetical protein [Cyclobacteriaceae bacterium]